MNELNEIKRQIRELRSWAHMPERDQIVNVLDQAKEFLLKGQPDTDTPEGFYFRDSDGKIKKVPPDFWWLKTEKRLVSVDDYQKRHGGKSGMRYGIYKTEITVE
jgi:hypothetical protein